MRKFYILFLRRFEAQLAGAFKNAAKAHGSPGESCGGFFVDWSTSGPGI